MKNKKKFVLIVDDYPENIKVLGNLLQKNNYEIGVATDGYKALEFVQKETPELILLDIMMPDLDGYEVCKRLKADPKTKEIPIIFLTAKSDTKDIVKGFELGGVDYISKPFKGPELLARVNTHINLKNANKEIRKLERKNTILAMAVTTNHELNQPLMSISGNLELLETTSSENQKKYISRMQNSIIRIRKILEKFRDIESSHFEHYTDETEMIVFNKDKE